jgi:hypothetical protein
MKYEAPYGAPGSNDPYINGNPSTGTMGSIPPAASIEFPQREIVNLINWSSLTPSDGDLHQLAKAVQTGRVNFAADIGSLSDFHLNFTPPLTGYIDGMIARFRALRNAPGPCTLRIDSLPQVPLVKRGGAALQAYDFATNDMLEALYDGQNNRFMLIGLSAVSALRAPLDYYVNWGGGSDSSDGLTAGTAFKTIARAIQGALSFNQNGFNVNIHCADGTSTDKIYCPPINGSGQINIYGNVSNPAACAVTCSSGSAVQVGGPNYLISGFTLSAPNPLSGDATCGIWVTGGGICYAQAVSFSSCANACIGMSGGIFSGVGPFGVNGTSSCLFGVDSGSCMMQMPNPPSLFLQAGTHFTGAFAQCGNGGILRAIFSSINGSATGPKYNAYGNGVINTGGNSTSYLPGDAAGVLSTGGQYV